MPEYAFDINLTGVVRVSAPNIEAARAAVEATVDSMEPCRHWVSGFNDDSTAVKLTEVSLQSFQCEQPFETDGVSHEN